LAWILGGFNGKMGLILCGIGTKFANEFGGSWKRILGAELRSDILKRNYQKTFWVKFWDGYLGRNFLGRNFT
jgi:hypothetical protein